VASWFQTCNQVLGLVSVYWDALDSVLSLIFYFCQLQVVKLPIVTPQVKVNTPTYALGKSLFSNT